MWRILHPPTRLLVASIAVCSTVMIASSVVLLVTMGGSASVEVSVPIAVLDYTVPIAALGFGCVDANFDGAKETVDPSGGKLRVACHVDERGDSWAVSQQPGHDGQLGTTDDRCWYTSSPPCTATPSIEAPRQRMD